MLASMNCIRPIGHRGRCTPTAGAAEVCGARMPYARAYCARRPGHATGAHRSRWDMDNRIAALRQRCGRELRLQPVLASVVILGPVPCRGCEWPVTWNGYEWQDTGLHGADGRTGYTHSCKISRRKIA